MTTLDAKLRPLKQRALAGILCNLLVRCAMAQTGLTSTLDAPLPVKGSSAPEVARFTDVTSASGISFEHVASHTFRKYLIETMGAGVALFDSDNDGRLDIFVVNGTQLSDPTPRGTIPRKTGPKEWNRLYHQKSDGRCNGKGGVARGGLWHGRGRRRLRQ